jgi:hypothetical protein
MWRASTPSGQAKASAAMIAVTMMQAPAIAPARARRRSSVGASRVGSSLRLMM